MGSRNGGGAPTMIRRRQSDFKMSFNLALRSLLTTCSKEDFSKEFPKFTSTEQERLYQRLFSELLFVQAFNQWRYGSYSGHYHFAWEYRGRTALDTVGQLVEEQCLDHFFSDKTNVMDAVHNLSTAKKAEVPYLRNLLERLYYFQFVNRLKDKTASSKLRLSYIRIKTRRSHGRERC